MFRSSVPGMLPHRYVQAHFVGISLISEPQFIIKSDNVPLPDYPKLTEASKSAGEVHATSHFAVSKPSTGGQRLSLARSGLSATNKFSI